MANPLPPISDLQDRFYWDSSIFCFRYKKSIAGMAKDSIAGTIKTLPNSSVSTLKMKYVEIT